MHKMLLMSAAAASIAAAPAVNAPAQAQPYYGPGMMGGYGPGYMMGPGMMGGYGPGPGMMGPGYGGGYGPGMMYGYGPDGRSYRGGEAYRGQRLCWRQAGADKNAGYYAPCRN